MRKNEIVIGIMLFVIIILFILAISSLVPPSQYININITEYCIKNPNSKFCIFNII